MYSTAVWLARYGDWSIVALLS